MNHIQHWKRADNFSKARHQEVVDAVNINLKTFTDGDLEVNKTSGGVNLKDTRGRRKVSRTAGVIWDIGPANETDFSDERYWVALASGVPFDDAETDPDDRILVSF